MATSIKTERELWLALEGLDDDLLDPRLNEAALDAELKGMGIEPDALAKRGGAFVAEVIEQQRLSWQTRAKQARERLQARVAKVAVPTDLDRDAVLARLEELRKTDSKVGSAIRMAARKRKPEESTDDELRALLVEMEALRSIEDDGSE